MLISNTTMLLALVSTTISDTQILVALVIALVTAFFALRLGTELYK